MKDIKEYIIEAVDKTKNKEKNDSNFYIAVEVVVPNKDTNSDKTEKRSKRVFAYDTYINMKNTGHMPNGDKILSITTISPSVASKEMAQEYISNKKN